MALNCQRVKACPDSQSKSGNSFDIDKFIIPPIVIPVPYGCRFSRNREIFFAGRFLLYFAGIHFLFS